MRLPHCLNLLSLSLTLALVGAAPRPAGAQAPPALRQAFSREITITNNHASPIDLPPVGQAFSREVTISNNHAFPTEAPDVRQALSRELTITNSHAGMGMGGKISISLRRGNAMP